ncbi:MAG: hypothetical protein GXP22_01885 [Gammaproteobacteria bacterium]|nr:hypothetical protein [Gammaproteobacteria bacterium]
MLSFIYNLNQSFEKNHGFLPNTLYLSPQHLQQLQDSFDQNMDIACILKHLDMDLLLDRTVVHPHVGWNPLKHSIAS